MPLEPDHEAERIRQNEDPLAARMAEDRGKAEEIERQELLKAADVRRQAELRLAARMAEDAAKEAEKFAEAETRKAAKAAKAEAKAAKKYWRQQPSRRRVIINLLAEAQEAEERRRKHPVKRAAWTAGCGVCGMVLWLLQLQWAIHLSQMKTRDLEKRYGAVSGGNAVASDSMISSAEMNQRLAALDRLETNRFLWAPLLNALQKTVIDDIQLTRLTGAQTYSSQPTHTVSVGSRKVVVPGETVEHISLSLEAKDTSSNELSYIKYKEILNHFEYFAAKLGTRDGFILDGVLKPPAFAKANSSNDFTKFVLSAHFPEVRRSQ